MVFRMICGKHPLASLGLGYQTYAYSIINESKVEYHRSMFECNKDPTKNNGLLDDTSITWLGIADSTDTHDSLDKRCLADVTSPTLNG